MAKIISTGRAVPPYSLDRETAKNFTRSHFGAKYRDIERLIGVFDSSRIDSRYFCVPPDWFLSAKCFKDKNDTYIKWAVDLGSQAISSCLSYVNISLEDIDYIIFVSTTGMATPSIDARLINLLKMRHDTKRTPVWGLGCVGGAMGLQMANDFLKGSPRSKVLLVAVELCGLTFNFSDYSKSNLVATALFADGAAAVLLANDADGPEILASQSTLWPDSLNVMGWNFHDEGMQVVFARAIPGIVRKYMRDNLTSFLARHDLGLSDIKYFLIHPGGAKVIDAYKETLGLNSDDVANSEKVLRNYGNMSSVTVLYILDEFMKGKRESGKNGIITALGPGFSSESLLFKT